MIVHEYITQDRKIDHLNLFDKRVNNYPKKLLLNGRCKEFL